MTDQTGYRRRTVQGKDVVELRNLRISENML
jgi:hypothetical protein